MSDEPTVAHKFHAPFHMVSCPLRMFLEVPIDGDPHYVSIELQRLDFEATKGYAVLLTNAMGEIDFYHDPHLPIDDAWFAQDGSTSNVKRGAVVARPFSDGDDGTRLTLETTPTKVTCELSFVDVAGRAIEITVQTERTVRAPRCPVIIPAPPTFDAFHQLPFLFAEEFWVLARNRSTIHVRVNGLRREPRRLMVPLRGRFRYLARVGDRISLVALNPTKSLSPWWSPLDADPTGWVRVDAHTEYELGTTSDLASSVVEPSIRAVRSIGTPARLQMLFDPPIRIMAEGAHATNGNEGRVSFRLGSESAGTAKYRLGQRSGLPRIEMIDVVQHWTPPWREVGLLGLSLIRRINRLKRPIIWTATLTNDGTQGEWSVPGRMESA